MGQPTEIDPRFSFRAVPVLETADAALVAEPAPPLTTLPVEPPLDGLPAARSEEHTSELQSR